MAAPARRLLRLDTGLLVLAVHGLEDLGNKLNALTRQGRWSDIAKEVPDDVTHLFAAVGRHDQIVAAIQRRFGGLVDALTPGRRRGRRRAA